MVKNLAQHPYQKMLIILVKTLQNYYWSQKILQSGIDDHRWAHFGNNILK